MAIEFDPIWPAPESLRFIATIAATVWLAVLSLWSYFGVWSTGSRRRKAIVVLRLIAVAMIGFVMLRPRVIYPEESEQSQSLVILADQSRSMLIEDGPGGLSRWESLVNSLETSKEDILAIQDQFNIYQHGFAEQLDQNLDLEKLPQGQQTTVGSSLQDVWRQYSQQRIVAVVLLSDGAQRALQPRDMPVLSAASLLSKRRIPVYTVGFGEASLTGKVHDVAVRDIQAPRTVYEKNNLIVDADIAHSGFPNEEFTVQLLVDDVLGNNTLVNTSSEVLGKDDASSVNVPLNWVPNLPGEYKMTVKVDPLSGETITQNNQFSTFVTVKKGGIKVLYLEGGIRPHEPRAIRRALDESPDIRLDRRVLLNPWRPDRNVGEDSWWEPGHYDVFILGDLDADRLSKEHWDRLRRAVERGAGLIMIGGNHSFGPGGHAETPLADVLPIRMDPFSRDRTGASIHLDSPLKVIPTEVGLRYVMRLGTQGRDERSWEGMPPLDGGNRFEEEDLKGGVQILAMASEGHPLLVAWEPAAGRVMAFAGDTTYRWIFPGNHRGEHIRFWRQIILWLSRKDDETDDHVHLALNRRRLRSGETLELFASAADSEGNHLQNAEFEVTIVNSKDETHKVAMARDELGARGEFDGVLSSGDYIAQVSVQSDGNQVGKAQVRFLVFEEDLEWDSPANLALLQSISRETKGQFLTPEELPRFFREFRSRPLLSYQSRREVSIWDKWPFLLLFVCVLSVEWILRKRTGYA